MKNNCCHNDNNEKNNKNNCDIMDIMVVTELCSIYSESKTQFPLQLGIVIHTAECMTPAYKHLNREQALQIISIKVT
jgi:hypothetical protein